MTAIMSVQNANSSMYVTIQPPPFRGKVLRPPLAVPLRGYEPFPILADFGSYCYLF